MRKLKEPMGRIGKLLNKLQDCDYDLVYQPGALHVTPDLLSRPSTEANVVEMQIGQCINWKAEQALDTNTSKLVELVAEKSSSKFNDKSSWSALAYSEEWFKLRDKLFLEKDVLIVQTDSSSKVVVPKQVISVILNFLHDSSIAGHRDYERTLDSVNKSYFWVRSS